MIMGSTGSRKTRKNRRKRPNFQNHKRSIIAICSVIVLLIIMLSVSSVTLRAKETSYKAQEAELTSLIEEEQARSAEINELEEYVGTDAYIEETAQDKLGMIYDNELIIKPR